MDEKKILVVDDETGVTTLVKLNLEKTGRYQVQTSNDPFQAVPLAKQFKPDLMILDIIMPGKDGGEVLAELQADAELKDLPVIFVTATMTERSLDEHKGNIKGYPVLAKPVEPKKLIKRIEEVLNGRR